jgi:putative membrane fusion protein
MVKIRRQAKRQLRIGGLLLLLAAVLTGIILLVAGSRGGVIEVGADRLERSTNSVIIRDETVAAAEAYGKINYVVSEGASVLSGQKVAEVYMWGYTSNDLKELQRLREEIRSYQVDVLLQDIVNRDLQNIEEQIDDLCQRIAACVGGNSQEDLLDLQRELSALLDSRRDYLKSSVQPDEELSRKYEEESRYVGRLDEWRREVLSSDSGVISFHLDGYEALLNEQNLQQLSSSDISDALKGKEMITTAVGAQEARVIYRLVDASHWYVAITTSKKETDRLVVGEKYQLSFSGYYDQEYEGECIYAQRNERGGVYIMQVNEDATPMLNTRTAKVTVSAEFTGLSVPNEAIVTKDDGTTGIMVRSGSEKTFAEIEILHIGKKRTIFRAKDGSLAAGMRYAK